MFLFSTSDVVDNQKKGNGAVVRTSFQSSLRWRSSKTTEKSIMGLEFTVCGDSWRSTEVCHHCLHWSSTTESICVPLRHHRFSTFIGRVRLYVQFSLVSYFAVVLYSFSALYFYLKLTGNSLDLSMLLNWTRSPRDAHCYLKKSWKPYNRSPITSGITSMEHAAHQPVRIAQNRIRIKLMWVPSYLLFTSFLLPCTLCWPTISFIAPLVTLSLTHKFLYIFTYFVKQLSYIIPYIMHVLWLATYDFCYSQLKHCIDALSTVHNF